MKNLRFEGLQPETQAALLRDPLITEQEGALRVYIPSRRKPAPAAEVVRFYCACVVACDPTPSATTAKRYGVTARRVRQLTEKVRAGAEPFPVDLPDSEALKMIEEAKLTSALSVQLKRSGSRRKAEAQLGRGPRLFDFPEDG